MRIPGRFHFSSLIAGLALSPCTEGARAASPFTLFYTAQVDDPWVAESQDELADIQLACRAGGDGQPRATLILSDEPYTLPDGCIASEPYSRVRGIPPVETLVINCAPSFADIPSAVYRDAPRPEPFYAKFQKRGSKQQRHNRRL